MDFGSKFGHKDGECSHLQTATPTSQPQQTFLSAQATFNTQSKTHHKTRLESEDPPPSEGSGRRDLLKPITTETKDIYSERGADNPTDQKKTGTRAKDPTENFEIGGLKYEDLFPEEGAIQTKTVKERKSQYLELMNTCKENVKFMRRKLHSKCQAIPSSRARQRVAFRWESNLHHDTVQQLKDQPEVNAGTCKQKRLLFESSLKSPVTDTKKVGFVKPFCEATQKPGQVNSRSMLDVYDGAPSISKRMQALEAKWSHCDNSTTNKRESLEIEEKRKLAERRRAIAARWCPTNQTEEIIKKHELPSVTNEIDGRQSQNTPECKGDQVKETPNSTIYNDYLDTENQEGIHATQNGDKNETDSILKHVENISSIKVPIEDEKIPGHEQIYSRDSESSIVSDKVESIASSLQTSRTTSHLPKQSVDLCEGKSKSEQAEFNLQYQLDQEETRNSVQNRTGNLDNQQETSHRPRQERRTRSILKVEDLQETLLSTLKEKPINTYKNQDQQVLSTQHDNNLPEREKRTSFATARPKNTSPNLSLSPVPEELVYLERDIPDKSKIPTLQKKIRGSKRQEKIEHRRADIKATSFVTSKEHSYGSEKIVVKQGTFNLHTRSPVLLPKHTHKAKVDYGICNLSVQKLRPFGRLLAFQDKIALPSKGPNELSADNFKSKEFKTEQGRVSPVEDNYRNMIIERVCREYKTISKTDTTSSSTENPRIVLKKVQFEDQIRNRVKTVSSSPLEDETYFSTKDEQKSENGIRNNYLRTNPERCEPHIHYTTHNTNIRDIRNKEQQPEFTVRAGHGTFNLSGKHNSSKLEHTSATFDSIAGKNLSDDNIDLKNRNIVSELGSADFGTLSLHQQKRTNYSTESKDVLLKSGRTKCRWRSGLPYVYPRSLENGTFDPQKAKFIGSKQTIQTSRRQSGVGLNRNGDGTSILQCMRSSTRWNNKESHQDEIKLQPNDNVASTKPTARSPRRSELLGKFQNSTTPTLKERIAQYRRSCRAIYEKKDAGSITYPILELPSLKIKKIYYQQKGQGQQIPNELDSENSRGKAGKDKKLEPDTNPFLTQKSQETKMPTKSNSKGTQEQVDTARSEQGDIAYFPLESVCRKFEHQKGEEKEELKFHDKPDWKGSKRQVTSANIPDDCNLEVQMSGNSEIHIEDYILPALQRNKGPKRKRRTTEKTHHAKQNLFECGSLNEQETLSTGDGTQPMLTGDGTQPLRNRDLSASDYEDLTTNYFNRLSRSLNRLKNTAARISRITSMDTSEVEVKKGVSPAQDFAVQTNFAYDVDRNEDSKGKSEVENEIVSDPCTLSKVENITARISRTTNTDASEVEVKKSLEYVANSTEESAVQTDFVEEMETNEANDTLVENDYVPELSATECKCIQVDLEETVEPSVVEVRLTETTGLCPISTKKEAILTHSKFEMEISEEGTKTVESSEGIVQTFTEDLPKQTSVTDLPQLKPDGDITEQLSIDSQNELQVAIVEETPSQKEGVNAGSETPGQKEQQEQVDACNEEWRSQTVRKKQANVIDTEKPSQLGQNNLFNTNGEKVPVLQCQKKQVSVTTDERLTQKGQKKQFNARGEEMPGCQDLKKQENAIADEMPNQKDQKQFNVNDEEIPGKEKQANLIDDEMASQKDQKKQFSAISELMPGKKNQKQFIARDELMPDEQEYSPVQDVIEDEEDCFLNCIEPKDKYEEEFQKDIPDGFMPDLLEQLSIIEKQIKQNSACARTIKGFVHVLVVVVVVLFLFVILYMCGQLDIFPEPIIEVEPEPEPSIFWDLFNMFLLQLSTI